ncbi:hypothetical protein OSTOST_05400 [Ostertagia ostertagi]
MTSFSIFASESLSSSERSCHVTKQEGLGLVLVYNIKMSYYSIFVIQTVVHTDYVALFFSLSKRVNLPLILRRAVEIHRYDLTISHHITRPSNSLREVLIRLGADERVVCAVQEHNCLRGTRVDPGFRESRPPKYVREFCTLDFVRWRPAELISEDALFSPVAPQGKQHKNFHKSTMVL